jgi:carbon storage regulator CsrA
MLVLTRKIGQQVVLPDQGITIEVMKVGKSRVCLGVSAPADIPVRRSDLRDRADGTGGERAANGEGPPRGIRQDWQEPKSPLAPAASFSDFDQLLAQWIAQRTGGRINELTVERNDGRIVVCGSTRSHYVRKLALTAVNEVLNAYGRLSAGVIDCKIDVAHIYWRSSGRTQRLTRLRREQT